MKNGIIEIESEGLTAELEEILWEVIKRTQTEAAEGGKMKKWKTFNVVGVTFRNKPSDTMTRLDMIGKYAGHSSTFRLEREPDNEYDPNAIVVRQVFKSGGSIVLGYVTKKNNVEFAPLMDDGWDPKLKFGIKFIDQATGECKGLQLRYGVEDEMS